MSRYDKNGMRKPPHIPKLWHPLTHRHEIIDLGQLGKIRYCRQRIAGVGMAACIGYRRVGGDYWTVIDGCAAFWIRYAKTQEGIDHILKAGVEE